MSVRGLIDLSIARVTQHSFRTVMLDYILASLKGVVLQKTAVMCLIHDTQEARVNDLYKVARHYIDLDRSESQALGRLSSRLSASRKGLLTRFSRSWVTMNTPNRSRHARHTTPTSLNV